MVKVLLVLDSNQILYGLRKDLVELQDLINYLIVSEEEVIIYIQIVLVKKILVKLVLLSFDDDGFSIGNDDGSNGNGDSFCLPGVAKA